MDESLLIRAGAIAQKVYEYVNVSRHADGDGLLAWFTDTTSTLKEIGTDFKSVSDHMKLYERCFVSIVAAKNTKAGIQE